MPLRYKCSGQILTFIKIMTRVQTLRGSTSLPTGPTYLQAWHGPKKKASGTWAQEESLGSRPEPTSAQTLPARVHHSTGAARLLWDANNQYKDPLIPVQGPFLKPLKPPT